LRERRKVFTEDTCLRGCAIGLGHFFDQAHRRPVSAHELAHGGVAFHAAQQFVLSLVNMGISWQC
jgi:hypothetical protein